MKKILIVDDDVNIVEYAEAVLEGEPSFIIGKAYDGNQALQVATQWPPHVVLLDITLPYRDGLSVLRLLKRDRRTAHAKVIIITGQDSGAAEVNAMKLGADAFMTKPFTPDGLFGKVAEVLGIDLAVAA
jgi:two-component system, OmpR family, response regulator